MVEARRPVPHSSEADQGWEPYIQAWHRRGLAEEHARQAVEQVAYAAACRAAQLLVDRFGADRVYLFGSLTGKAAAPFGSRSDIDLAVEGLPSRHYWTALAETEMEVPAGTRVDLVRLEDAFPSLAARVRSTGEVLADGAAIRGACCRPGE